MEVGHVITIVSVFLSAGFLGFIQFMINRRDKKKAETKEEENQVKELQEWRKKHEEVREKEVKELRQSISRLELMVLIADFPELTEEIMKVGERYFKVLKGDWYMTALFTKYLKDKDLPIPPWFHQNQEGESK